MPTSGSPVSDIFIDNLKKMTSKAQLEQKEMPTSGSPVSDFFIDGLKKMGPQKGNSFTQLSSKSNANDDATTQPSDNQTSDVIMDVLRKVNGGTTAKTEQQLHEKAPAAATADKTKQTAEKKVVEKKDVAKKDAKVSAKAPADKNQKG